MTKPPLKVAHFESTRVAHFESTGDIDRDELFAKLRLEINAVVPAAERPAILELVEMMEKSNDKGVLLGAYSRFVQLVAAHSTIFSIYVPTLAQLFA